MLAPGKDVKVCFCRNVPIHLLLLGAELVLSGPMTDPAGAGIYILTLRVY